MLELTLLPGLYFLTLISDGYSDVGTNLERGHIKIPQKGEKNLVNGPHSNYELNEGVLPRHETALGTDTIENLDKHHDPFPAPEKQRLHHGGPTHFQNRQHFGKDHPRPHPKNFDVEDPSQNMESLNTNARIPHRWSNRDPAQPIHPGSGLGESQINQHNLLSSKKKPITGDNVRESRIQEISEPGHGKGVKNFQFTDPMDNEQALMKMKRYKPWSDNNIPAQNSRLPRDRDRYQNRQRQIHNRPSRNQLMNPTDFEHSGQGHHDFSERESVPTPAKKPKERKFRVLMKKLLDGVKDAAVEAVSSTVNTVRKIFKNYLTGDAKSDQGGLDHTTNAQDRHDFYRMGTGETGTGETKPKERRVRILIKKLLDGIKTAAATAMSYMVKPIKKMAEIVTMNVSEPVPRQVKPDQEQGTQKMSNIYPTERPKKLIETAPIKVKTHLNLSPGNSSQPVVTQELLPDASATSVNPQP